MALDNLRPSVRIEINGRAVPLSRFVSMRLSDYTGVNDDTLNIVFSDKDNLLGIPEPGAKVRVWAGYGEDVVSWGEWIHNDYSSTSHQNLTINCRPYSDLVLRTYTTKRYNESFLSMVNDIARRNSLKAVVFRDFRNYRSESFTQKNESDLNFLTRICKEYGAYFKISDGRLCIMKRCTGLNEEGNSLTEEEVNVSDVKRNGIMVKGGLRKAYKSCEAFYYNPYKKINERLVKGEGNPRKRLSSPFRSKKEAEIKMSAFLKNYNASNQSAELSMIEGRPALRSETPVRIVGHKPETDGIWFVKSAVHSVNTSMITTKADLIREV